MTATIICILLLTPYAAWLIASIRALRRHFHVPATQETNSSEPLTAIVCTRHETADELSRCLDSLTSALAPTDSLIVVTDHTPEATTSWLASHYPQASVIANPLPQGKKFAQRAAVLHATTRALVSIDADCQVSPSFISAVRSAIPPESDFMTLLPVTMRGDGFFGSMMEMEFACLQVVTAGSALINHPTMANGAGMAFSRSLFLAHDPDARFSSGDDMFLLAHTISAHAPISYAATPSALVTTSAPPSVTAYLRQRTRWLGKAGGYSSSRGGRDVMLLAVSVLLAVVAWPLASLCAATGLAPWWVAALVFFLKLTLDVSAFRTGRKLLRSDIPVIYALPLELLYPLMTVVVAFRAMITDRHKW